MCTTLRHGKMYSTASRMAVLLNCRRQIWILDKTSYLPRSTHCSRNTALSDFHLACQYCQKYSANIWTKLWTAYLFPCADDIKVQGSTEEHHDIHLLETVAKVQQAGLRFNPDKCSIKKRQIEYFGRVISPRGVTPCPRKVKDIIGMTSPADKQELQSFLGAVTFMLMFIPNLSKKIHLMRGLLKKDVHFEAELQGHQADYRLCH